MISVSSAKNILPYEIGAFEQNFANFAIFRKSDSLKIFIFFRNFKNSFEKFCNFCEIFIKNFEKIHKITMYEYIYVIPEIFRHFWLSPTRWHPKMQLLSANTGFRFTIGTQIKHILPDVTFNFLRTYEIYGRFLPKIFEKIHPTFWTPWKRGASTWFFRFNERASGCSWKGQKFGVTYTYRQNPILWQFFLVFFS